MILKQVPEDFQVFEISERFLDENGRFELYRMTKTELNTEQAVQIIADFLKIPRKRIGVAGTKDRNAITEQDITIEGNHKEHLRHFKHEKIRLEYTGRFKESLRLGMLEGNRFVITVRGLKDEQLREIEKIPNYFDEQRFSTNNVELGRHILKSEFKEACEIISRTDRRFGEKIDAHLEENKNDYVGALLLMPRFVLLMYVHSFQSFLFNKALEINNESELVPIIGFASELNPPYDEIYETLLEEQEMVQRDFVVREIPWLTVEGTTRKSHFNLESFKASKRTVDELNLGFEKQTLEFRLPKGCYATMAVKYLYSSPR